MSSSKPESKSKLSIEERVQRIRTRMGLPNDVTLSNAPFRIFVPRTADIGKPRRSSN